MNTIFAIAEKHDALDDALHYGNYKDAIRISDELMSILDTLISNERPISLFIKGHEIAKTSKGWCIDSSHEMTAYEVAASLTAHRVLSFKDAIVMKEALHCLEVLKDG